MADNVVKRWLGMGEKSVAATTEKSFDLADYRFGLDGQSSGITFNPDKLTPRQAMDMYQTVSPVAQAIDQIVDEFAAAAIGVRKGFETTYNHDALDLLDTPNPDHTRSQFFRALAVPYLVTGNNFITVGGPVGRVPLELTIAPPQFGTLGPVSDRHVSSIKLDANWGRAEFTRQQRRRDPARYLHGTQNELYWLQRPNSVTPWTWGYSDLTPIQSEIRQFHGVSLQNEALLNKSGRVTGVLSTEHNLNEEQFLRTQAQIEAIARNASDGGTLLFDGGNWKFEEMALSPKDMDFLNQKQDVSRRIFAAYNIPLPLVDTSTMTLNNYQAALEAFIDDAFFPWTIDMLGALTRLFRIRGLLSEDESLVVDPQSIQALTVRRIREAVLRGKIGATTLNEQRDHIGLERLEGGGADIVYQNASLVPVAGDGFTEDQPTEPSPSATSSDSRFEGIMRVQLKADGTPYSEAEIAALVRG